MTVLFSLLNGRFPNRATFPHPFAYKPVYRHIMGVPNPCGVKQ